MQKYEGIFTQPNKMVEKKQPGDKKIVRLAL